MNKSTKGVFVLVAFSVLSGCKDESNSDQQTDASYTTVNEEMVSISVPLVSEEDIDQLSPITLVASEYMKLTVPIIHADDLN